MINSRQVIKEFSELQGRFPPQFIEDYMGLKSDVDRLNAVLDQLTPKFGDGSPEGVTTSNLNRFYFDTLNGVLYINPNPNTNTGWVTA